MAFIKSVLMYCGHHPDAIDDYSLKDIRLFGEALPVVLETVNPGVSN